MDLNKLTKEQRQALKEQFLAEEKQKADQVNENRKTYKDLVNTTIPSLFNELIGVSAGLSAIKTKVFNELDTLVKMKAELYDSEIDQYSHSFTTAEGITLIIGRRYNDGWDDTVTVGVEKVKNWISSRAKDDNSKQLVKAILQLLATDQKTGLLKASRVLQLKKMADEIGDPVFIDAMQIIHDAYRPVKTKEFVTCRYRDAEGNTVYLPLDISTAEFDFKMKQHATDTKPEAEKA